MLDIVKTGVPCAAQKRVWLICYTKVFPGVDFCPGKSNEKKNLAVQMKKKSLTVRVEENLIPDTPNAA